MALRSWPPLPCARAGGAFDRLAQGKDARRHRHRDPGGPDDAAVGSGRGVGQHGGRRGGLGAVRQRAGGLHGRKIKVELKDDGYNPGRAVANLNEMQGHGLHERGAPGLGRAPGVEGQDRGVQDPHDQPVRQPRHLRQAAAARSCATSSSVYHGLRGRGRLPRQLRRDKLGAKKIAVFHQNDEYGKGGLEGVNRGLKGWAAR